MTTIVDTLTPWFALQTRPRWESAVAGQLAQKGCECFLPTYRDRRRWSDRVKEVVRPLFESYVFCRLDLSRPVRLVSTPGVIRIVSIAGRPAPVDDDEIAALRKIVAAGLQSEPWEWLRSGQRVRIESGSLAGLEGILLSFRGRRRVVVSVSLLQRSVGVELDHEQVTPVGRRPLEAKRPGAVSTTW